MTTIRTVETKVDNALIFIPDISGFTKFVNETEITHSQHIIDELITEILEANNLNMTVAEIEGDAVLFFLRGDAPSAQQIVTVVKKMFINFHSYLKTIERDRVCQCGACSTASNLTLKFIVHYGEISISAIQGHGKPGGRAVITVHKLLKNNLEHHEYVLLTSAYIKHLNKGDLEKSLDWSHIREGKIGYEHVGEIEYQYSVLTPLRKQLPPVTPPDKPEKFAYPIITKIQIKADLNSIYATLIDLELRPKWTHGLKTIEFNKDEIIRTGSKHICELPTGHLELETLHAKKEKDKIEYVERATKNSVFINATTFYQLEDKKSATILTITFHYKKMFLAGWIIDPLLRLVMRNAFKKSAENLKKYCEKNG